MKISLNWLREYLKSEATDEQLISKMTEIGIEVEEVLDTTKGLEGFIVGEIKAKEKHPNADKLNVLSVWTGSELLQVVCGAPNCYVG
ncbi:MAG: phenylalanine--tRNA ligase subunit beta, partial [Alphaproteobacteria bacterium]|nr:phenylalanine--tRNA ligase subunit beta [Alphaproteobacteria bacterium]